MDQARKTPLFNPIQIKQSSCPNQQTQSYIESIQLGYSSPSRASSLTFGRPSTQASKSAATLALDNTSKALGISSAELSSGGMVPSSSTLGFAGFASSVTPPFRSLSTSPIGTILKAPDSGSAATLSVVNTSTPLAESSGTLLSSSTPSLGYLSTSAFGASVTPLGLGSSSVFGQTNSSSVGTTFGPTFSEFGGKNSPGYPLMFPTATPTQILSSRNAPAPSSTGAPFCGSGTFVFGSLHTPAFESALSPTLCKAGPPFGVSSACPFGSASTSFRSAISPTFGSAPSPVLGNSGTACGSVFSSSNIPAFGSATTPACTQFAVTSAPIGTTEMASGTGSQQPLFNELCWGSRLAAYTPTEEIGGGNTLQASGKLLSISAMPAYNGKCHEELRWEDYRMGLAPSLVEDQISPVEASNSVGITGRRQCLGSRVAGYTRTAEVDHGNFAHPFSKIESISAMCAYGNRSHEELRWENYQLGDKGRILAVVPDINAASTQSAGLFKSITHPREGTPSTIGHVSTSSVGQHNQLSIPSTTMAGNTLVSISSTSTTGLGRNLLISISSTPSTRLDGSVSSSISSPAQSAQASGNLSVTLGETPAETVNIVMSPDGTVNIVTSTVNIQFLQTSPLQASGDLADTTNQGTAENISTTQSSQMAQGVPIANAPRALLTQQISSMPGPIMQQGISEMPVLVFNNNDELHIIPEENAPSSGSKDEVLLRDTHIPLDKTDNPAESSIYHETSIEASIEILMPKLMLADYYTDPPIHELAMKEKAEPGFCTHVKDFVIGRHRYGSIKLIGETDVVGLDLESFVRFNDHEIVFYTSDNSKTPSPWPAEVTLLNIMCFDKKAGEYYVAGPKVEKYKKMLVRKAQELGAEHLSYDPYTGEWKFRVDDLNKYNKG